MDDKARTKLSKFLSRVLRHRPEALGIELDEAGWVDVDVLLERCRATRRTVSHALLEEIVRTNEKRRFSFSEDGRRIRANQGHSVEVDLGYPPTEPPEWLLHGTVAATLASIRSEGLRKMRRHHVHLSADEQTASQVGQRRGRPVVLRVHAGRMSRDGHPFYRSKNGVWLTDCVPPEYIDFD